MSPVRLKPLSFDFSGLSKKNTKTWNSAIYRANVFLLGADNSPVEIVRCNYMDSYWTIPQMIAYQSSSGLGLHTGDLVGSGTISSPVMNDHVSKGCLVSEAN